jgi:hypothetical protein
MERIAAEAAGCQTEAACACDNTQNSIGRIDADTDGRGLLASAQEMAAFHRERGGRERGRRCRRDTVTEAPRAPGNARDDRGPLRSAWQAQPQREH